MAFRIPIYSFLPYTLWKLNIAMENGPFIIGDLPIQIVMFLIVMLVYQREVYSLCKGISPQPKCPYGYSTLTIAGN